LKLALDGGVRGLNLEGALHVPDGLIQFALVVGNNAQADIGYEIIRHAHQHTLENIHRVVITFGFQKSLAKQAIGFNILGEGLENVTAMRDSLIALTIIDQVLDQAVVIRREILAIVCSSLSMP